jgi:hypothetical protein
MYCPYTGAADETKDEFAGYAGLMAIALTTVNPVKYASMISGLKSVLKWMALDDGRIYDCVDENGKLWRSKIAPFGGAPTEGEFLILPIAMALLAGAGS